MNRNDRTPNDPPPTVAPPRNPFATRHVRPGAIPYFFPDGVTAEILIDRLAANRWRGEIVGPHGTGKSTLLATLVDVISRHGKPVVVYRLREGERRLPPTPCAFAAVPRDSVVVIDGFEQLGWLHKTAVRWSCKRRGLGLLVTSHATVGLPQLWRTGVDSATLKRVVAHLLAAEPAAAALIREQDIAAAVEAHPTNVREALFALYDLVERRRRENRRENP